MTLSAFRFFIYASANAIISMSPITDVMKIFTTASSQGQGSQKNKSHASSPTMAVGLAEKEIAINTSRLGRNRGFDVIASIVANGTLDFSRVARLVPMPYEIE